MSETTVYSVVAKRDGSAARLGWTSSATGITYCGLCLGAQIRVSVGAHCANCGGCVVGVFDDKSDIATIRQAWQSALPTTGQGLSYSHTEVIAL